MQLCIKYGELNGLVGTTILLIIIKIIFKIFFSINYVNNTGSNSPASAASLLLGSSANVN